MALVGTLGSTAWRTVYWKIALGILPSSDEDNSASRTGRQTYLHSLSRVLPPERERELRRRTDKGSDRKATVPTERAPVQQAGLLGFVGSLWGGSAVPEACAVEEEEAACAGEGDEVILWDRVTCDSIRTFSDDPDIVVKLNPLLPALDRILFVFARLYPDVGFCQGMADLVAVILLALQADCDDQDADSELSHICSAEFVEADGFVLFKNLMDVISPWFLDYSKGKDKGPLLDDCEQLLGERLRDIDPPFASYLREEGLCPELFMVRWMRLLFVRELPLEDVLVVWDVMFALGLKRGNVESVGCVALSMLLYSRWKIVGASFESALAALTVRQSTGDAALFVEQAVALHDTGQPLEAPDAISRYSGEAKHYVSVGDAAARGVLAEVESLRGADVDSTFGLGHSSGWVFVAQEKEVVIFKKATSNSKFHSFMGRGVIPLPAEMIFAVLRDINHRYSVDRMLKKIKVVRPINKDTCLIHQLHVATQCVLTYSRDSLSVLRSKFDLESGSYVQASQSVAHPLCPPDPEHVRASILSSGWVVSPLSESSSMVSYITQVDVRGNVPAKLINLVSQRQPLSVAYLRQALSSDPTLYKRLHLRSDRSETSGTSIDSSATQSMPIAGEENIHVLSGIEDRQDLVTLMDSFVHDSSDAHESKSQDDNAAYSQKCVRAHVSVPPLFDESADPPVEDVHALDRDEWIDGV